MLASGLWYARGEREKNMSQGSGENSESSIVSCGRRYIVSVALDLRYRKTLAFNYHLLIYGVSFINGMFSNIQQPTIPITTIIFQINNTSSRQTTK
jgi:hypothetical protein